MTFKMKPFSGFGNSPMKQKRFIRTPEGFDHEASKKLAKQEFKRNAAKSGHGTIKDLEAKNKKNFKQFQAQKQKAKDFVKNLKPQIKKKPTGTLRTTAKTLQGVPKQFAAKAKTKMVKQVAKKGLGALARTAGRASGVGTILSLGYQAYKAGQKKSGGKINPKQKSIIKEGKKISGGSIMGQGIKKLKK